MFGQPFLRLACRLALVVAVPAAAQPGASRPDALTEREQVTAIDLVIELSKNDVVAAEAPEGLTFADFSVEQDGQPQAVVGLDVPPSSEAWRVLLYFDQRLASPTTIRWAASALAERASALTELGRVQIVVADPEPHLLLGPSRDPSVVDRMLSGIFLDSQKGHETLSLREEFLVERESSEELSTRAAINALLGEELRLTSARQDALLSTLVDELPGTARRVLFLVSDGFDSTPERFYREFGDVDDQTLGVVERMTQEWAKTIAAYGWSVIPVQAPEEEVRRTWGIAPGENEHVPSIRTPGIAARLDGSLDPEKAAALHELGQRLAEQGNLEEAEKTLNEALRFYHEHKRYAAQRAAVLVDLGDLLYKLERTWEARQAIRQAVGLDPQQASSHPFVRARLEEPEAALGLLAELSGGRLTRSGEDLSEAITSLARRVRLTFQLRGAPDGEHHRVVVTYRNRGLDVRSPSWIRFGTPPTVSALRARRLLAGEVEHGSLQAKCRFVQASRSYSTRKGSLEIDLRDPDKEALIGAREMRLTVGIAREEGPFVIRQETVTFDGAALRMPFEVGEDDVWLAVVVDEVSTGLWGGATTEL